MHKRGEKDHHAPNSPKGYQSKNTVPRQVEAISRRYPNICNQDRAKECRADGGPCSSEESRNKDPRKQKSEIEALVDKRISRRSTSKRSQDCYQCDSLSFPEGSLTLRK